MFLRDVWRRQRRRPGRPHQRRDAPDAGNGAFLRRRRHGDDADANGGAGVATDYYRLDHVGVRSHGHSSRATTSVLLTYERRRASKCATAKLHARWKPLPPESVTGDDADANDANARAIVFTALPVIECPALSAAVVAGACRWYSHVDELDSSVPLSNTEFLGKPCATAAHTTRGVAVTDSDASGRRVLLIKEVDVDADARFFRSFSLQCK